MQQWFPTMLAPCPTWYSAAGRDMMLLMVLEWFREALEASAGLCQARFCCQPHLGHS